MTGAGGGSVVPVTNLAAGLSKDGFQLLDV